MLLLLLLGFDDGIGYGVPFLTFTSTRLDAFGSCVFRRLDFCSGGFLGLTVLVWLNRF